MKWMEEALKELGDAVTEIPGPGSNKRIEEYHASTAGGESLDEVPWCASFVSWALARAGVESTRSKRARSYLDWGIPTSADLGAIVVLTRGTNPASGHVGFYVGKRNGVVYVLGGNQRDRVSVAKFMAFRVLAFRWPEGVSR